MPTFGRSGEYYTTHIVTGPSWLTFRMTFTDDVRHTPSVTLLRPDPHHGNATDVDVANAVANSVKQVNERHGTNLCAGDVRYQSDNDARCFLIRRAVFLIACRLVEHGEQGFDDLYQRCEEANERWADTTVRRCPECNSLCPEYRVHCLACKHHLGRC